MEIKATIHIPGKLVSFYLSLMVTLLLSFAAVAQPNMKQYTIKNGRMFITIGKPIRESSLDSFVAQYDLRDLSLKEFITNGFRDSLIKSGWKIEKDNKVIAMISKPLFGTEDLKDPADRIIFSERLRDFSERFPSVSSSVLYGYNRFRNKPAFAVKNSTVTFYLRGHTNARRVILAGSFNDWDPDGLAMSKTDSGWIAGVKLDPGKYWYKFIADGGWMTDSDNRLGENDGQGNINSVFYKTNAVFKLNGYNDAKKVYVAGSFNKWKSEELLMNKTTDGWELPLYLADGTHTYRFIADGKWFIDPANPEKFPNEFGDFNSVFRQGTPRLFHLEGYTNAKQVTLVGSFNKWRTDELFMKKTTRGWEIQYALGPGNYEYYFQVDGRQEVKQPNPDSLNGSGNMRNYYFVIDPNYTFRLKGFTNAKRVYLSGDFNSWSANTFAMKKEGNEWVLPVHLFMGKQLYKFVVDGQWIKDPANPLWEGREQNSVIWISK
jgi:hypothetical protein